MGYVFKLILSSVFYASLAFAQENVLPLKSDSIGLTESMNVDWKSTAPKEISIPKSGKFITLRDAPEGTFKFEIEIQDSEGKRTTRQINLGTTAHNILLRKALLEKLGYELPAMRFLSKLQITFNDHAEKKLFISKLEQRTSADTDRWITDDGKTDLILQDAIISDIGNNDIDLSSGFLTKKTLQENHDLAALIIPYTLTHFPESINLLPWVSGSIYNEGVKVEYPNSDDYTPTSNNIHLILKRIASLTREDWIEIAQAAELPKAVETLAIEKLISRRNSFLELFSMSEIDLDFNPKISLKPDLINGQIHKKEWPGYASHFSFGTPGSPLNPGEMFAFSKSIFFSSILSSAVGLLNDLPIFHTNTEEILEKHLANIDPKRKNQKIPLGAWGFPFASGELIFSRDIVAGNFLGTDNLFQLADQFGIRLSLGAQLSMDKLPTAVGGAIKGSISISRTYTHLKPIKSIKKTNKYGYQNAVVPFFIRSSVQKLNPLFENGFESLPIEQKQKVYTEALQDFKSKIATGESIMITDSLITDGKISGNVNLYKLVDLSAAATATELIISRLHIYRKDENTFQIYKDFGQAFQPSFGIEIGIRKPIPEGISSYLPSTNRESINTAMLPIIRVKWGKSIGNTSVQYYSVDFSAKNNTTQEIDESVAQLRIIQETLIHNSTEVLKKHISPYLIDNNFKEKNLQERFLFFSHRRLKSASDIKVTAPNGEQKTYVRDFFGKSNAFDYHNTTTNMLDFLNEMITHSKVDFRADASVNPGYTTNGIAKNKLLTFEAEQMPDGSLKDSFVNLSHSYNGWKLSKKKIQKRMDRLSLEYGGKLFPSTALNETEKMFLYTISLDIHLYTKAIEHLVNLSEEDVFNLFARHGINLNHRRIDDRIVNHLQKFKITHSSKSLLRAISIADRLLPAAGLIELFGGKENIFITAKVEGFRQGDENGSNPIVSNTIGIAGSPQTHGPLSAIQTKLGMSKSEFLSLWILGRIL